MDHNTFSSQPINWHAHDSQTILDYLQTNTTGLTDVDIERSKAHYGSNIPLIDGGISGNLKSMPVPWKHPLTLIFLFLLFATIMLVLLDGIESAIPIILIVGLNLAIVIFQVYQTEKARSSLDQKANPIRDSISLVKVRRNGEIQQILAHDIVIGDILILKQGDTILADGRLFESANLYVDEASLTGEAYPVEKVCHAVNIAESPLPIYRNMVYKNTKVVRGSGTAVVVAIGRNTHFDQIIYAQQTDVA